MKTELWPAGHRRRVVGLEGLEGGVALVTAIVVPVLPVTGEAARPVAAPHRRGGDLVARGGRSAVVAAASAVPVVLLGDLAAVLRAAVTVLRHLGLLFYGQKGAKNKICHTVLS